MRSVLSLRVWCMIGVRACTVLLCRFIQRGFAPCDLEKLPKERYEKIDKSRGSKSFRKILSVSSSLGAAPSKDALPTDLTKYGRVQ